MHLHTLFIKNNKLVRTENFSRSIQETHGDIKLIFPMADVELVYRNLIDILGKNSPNYTFIMRGWDTIKSAVGRKSEKYLMSGNIAYQLHHICKSNLDNIPPWLPIVTQKKSPKEHTHQFLYLFDWSTVTVDSIPNNLIGYFTQRLNGELSNASTNNAPSAMKKRLQNIPALSKSNN